MRLEHLSVSDYATLPDLHDEMVTQTGDVRAHWRYLADSLAALGLPNVQARAQEARRLLRESGATYHVYGDPQGRERPWQLDPIPLVLSSDEWRDIETGLMQRAELLNLILKDIYGPQELVRSGLLPVELVHGHPGFLRPCHGIRTPGTHPLVLYAADLARGPDGRIHVLADRTQAPSGAGYALENRVVMTRILPSLYRDSHVHRLALFFQNLRASLAALSPRRETEPRVVILTPGPLNETYFEHTYLASYLGYTLARGDDLTVRDGRLWLRSMRRLEPVDVLLRRVDDHYCDPLELYPASRLGVPGLVEAVRRGTVTVANPLGASVLENPALHAFLPAIARHYLGRPLDLPALSAWWCGDGEARQYVLEHLEHLVIRPIHREAGSRPIVGAQLDEGELDALAAKIRSHPSAYVGLSWLPVSCVPALTEAGLAPRQAVIRTFLVAREDGYVVMPGGLTRIAPSPEARVISNQAGGFSKDTWILATEPEKQVTLIPPRRVASAAVRLRAALPGGAADNLFWVGRYAERAKQCIRIVRTVLRVHHDAIEFGDPVERACLEDLLAALTHVTGTYPGFVGEGAADRKAHPAPELLSVIVDVRRVGSIAFAVQAMLTAAHAARDRLTTDLWRLVDRVRARLEALPAGSSVPLDGIDDDLDGLLFDLVALFGLAQESMMREPAWLFLELGRRLERALLLVAWVRATMVGAREPEIEAQWLASVLQSTESFRAYRRGYDDAPTAEGVLGLLLFDETNPRSLGLQLRKLEAGVNRLTREEGEPQLAEETRTVLDAASSLWLAKLGELAAVDRATARRPVLDELLARITRLLTRCSDVLTQRFFTDVRGFQQLGRMDT